MKKLFSLIILSLVVCTDSLPVTAKTSTQKTLTKKRKGKSKTQQTDSGSLGYYVKRIVPVVLIGVGAVVYYYKKDGSEEISGGTSIEKYKAFIKSKKKKGKFFSGADFVTDKPFMAKVKKAIDAKGEKSSGWEIGLLDRDDGLVNDVAAILYQKKVDITNTENPTPTLGCIEHGAIDGNGVFPLEMAFVLTQLLYLLQDVTSPEKAKEIVNANNNRILANIVERHGSIDMEFYTEQPDGNNRANCFPSIYVLLNVGGANPEINPELNSGIFKAGGKTIKEAAKEKGIRIIEITDMYGNPVLGENGEKWGLE